MPRFRPTTRRHPFDLHSPVMPCSKPTGDIPRSLRPPPTPFDTPSEPLDIRHVLSFHAFFLFLCALPVEAVTRGKREGGERGRIDFVLLYRHKRKRKKRRRRGKGGGWMKGLLALASDIGYNRVMMYATTGAAPLDHR